MKAQQSEIINELVGLGQHYSRNVRTPDQEERFLRDYIEDLANFPMSAVKAGCTAWRHSEATRFPTPGQLLAKVRANLPRSDRGSSNEPWRELTDSEYAGLTLREKIRHHQISAQACRRKAGPMWGAGHPLDRADMDPQWHRWTALAENHARESARLRDKLADVEGAPRFKPSDIPGMLGPKPSTLYPKTVRAALAPFTAPTDGTGLTLPMREHMGIPDADDPIRNDGEAA